MKIEKALKIVWWSFLDDGWQDGKDGTIAPSYKEIEAMNVVLENFKNEDNYVIDLIKASKDSDYCIYLEENTDSFGEHIYFYYDGENERLEEISGDTINVDLFNADFIKLKAKTTLPEVNDE